MDSSEVGNSKSYALSSSFSDKYLNMNRYTRLVVGTDRRPSTSGHQLNSYLNRLFYRFRGVNIVYVRSQPDRGSGVRYR